VVRRDQPNIFTGDQTVSSGNLNVLGGQTVTGPLSVGGDQRVQGNVGIGTDPSPSAKLLVNGTVTATSFSGDGAGLGGLWKLGGNTSTTPGTHFLGTTDNQPLEFKVNGRRGLRLEYAAAGSDQTINVIGGYGGNFVGSGVVGATIAGGGTTNINGFSLPNQATEDFATIGGGYGNTAGDRLAAVGGGDRNTANGFVSTVGGGQLNAANGSFATVPGGAGNTAAAYSFAAGRRAKATNEGAFVWADSQNADFASTANNQFLIRAAGGVGINTNNPNGAALAVNGTVTAASFTGDGSVLTGVAKLGAANTFTGAQTIGGALSLQLPMSFDLSTATVGFTGGDFAPALVMSGGPAPGVLRLRNGLEVWPNTNATSAGYIDVRNVSGTANITLNGANGAITAVTVTPTSDRNAKENFREIRSAEVLEKVAALPISRWTFKGETDSEHIGPMAQDFRAAFGLGADDRHIATVDADGVALAAIQGLNQKLADELKRRDAENAELKARLERLERLLEARGGAR
jgi:hypothetical protein